MHQLVSDQHVTLLAAAASASAVSLQCGWTASTSSSSSSNSQRTPEQHDLSVNGVPAAVTVRLLSAEDAFLPVMNVVAQRCNTTAVQNSSPRAAAAAAARSRQPPQQCEPGAVNMQRTGLGACSCSCSQQQGNGTAVNPCEASQQQQSNSSRQPNSQQQQQQGSMLPELAAVTGNSDITAEPQLLLVYGPVLTLAGYPPFHTRAAEVQHMGPLTRASQQGIADAVAAYCKVLQRHGA
jgi:hypothetical protein